MPSDLDAKGAATVSGRSRVKSGGELVQGWLRTHTLHGALCLALGSTVLCVVSFDGTNSEEGGTEALVGGPAELHPGEVGLALPFFKGESGADDAVTKKASKGHVRTARSAPAETKFTGPKLLRRPRDLAFPPGTIAKASLVGGASNGPAKAVVTAPVISGGETLLDAGVILIGVGQSGEDRLVIRFDKAVFTDGTVSDIAGVALDAEDQIPGLKGSRIGHYGAKIAGSVGLGFVSGMSAGLQQTQSYGPVTMTMPTVRNALLGGLSQTALEQSQNLMGSLKNDQPVIEVAAGSPILIMLGTK